MKVFFLVLFVTVCTSPDILLADEKINYDVGFKPSSNLKLTQREDITIELTSSLSGSKKKNSQRFQITSDVTFVPESKGFRVMTQAFDKKYWVDGKKKFTSLTRSESTLKSSFRPFFPPNNILGNRTTVKAGDSWILERNLPMKTLDIHVLCKSKIRFAGFEKYGKKHCLVFKETGRLINKKNPTHKGKLTAKYLFDPELKLIIYSRTNYLYRTYFKVEYNDIKDEIPLTFHFKIKNNFWVKKK